MTLGNLSLKTVLVVDDAPENLALVNALLRGLYKVKVASGGKRALEIARATPPDLILLDVMMPGLDGYEVCRQLKSQTLTQDIPVIFLTAKTQMEDEQRGFDLGAVDYITKPISPPLLLARLRAQMSLKEVRDALERRNAADTQRFEVAMAQQMEINALKSSFVSMTTHEFRTPLASIIGSQELLRHYADRMGAKERADVLDNIESAARRMVTMLDQVLTIGRADANLLEFNPQPMDLAVLCRKLREEALAGRDVPLMLTMALDELSVVADEKLLRHILGNLLSNALKYSPQNLGVEFRVTRDLQGLVFEVEDRGIGIPPDDLPRLFGNYHRASNVGDIAGTGLGLTIVKRAAESHGGSISVNSTLGQGTCFTVRIPQQATTQ